MDGSLWSRVTGCGGVALPPRPPPDGRPSARCPAHARPARVPRRGPHDRRGRERRFAGTAASADVPLATGVVAADGAPLRFRFAHDLLRDTLLADLTVAQRQRLHARIARAIADRSTDDERALPEIAHHLVEAGAMGNLAEAVEAARQAGQQALDRFAFDEAARWFDRALAVLLQRKAVSGAEPSARHALLITKGTALYRAGLPTQAREALIEAIEVAAAAVDDLDGVSAAAAGLSHTGGIWTWVDLGRRWRWSGVRGSGRREREGTGEEVVAAQPVHTQHRHGGPASPVSGGSPVSTRVWATSLSLMLRC